MSCLYILKINPFLIVSFANIFSHSVGCLFILFMVSFAVQKLSPLSRSHLLFFFFYLYFHYSRKWIQKDVAPIYVNECTAVMFSSKSFIVSFLTLRSLIIDFEFIFVCIILFTYLFILAGLGLCSCVDFSLVAVSRGYSLVEVLELLIAVASLFAEHGL